VDLPGWTWPGPTRLMIFIDQPRRRPAPPPAGPGPAAARPYSLSPSPSPETGNRRRDSYPPILNMPLTERNLPKVLTLWQLTLFFLGVVVYGGEMFVTWRKALENQ
jgi:hypothetical protein